MSRVQLALRVSDLEASVAFYSKLFDAEPAKRRPGYANFAITEPLGARPRRRAVGGLHGQGRLPVLAKKDRTCC